MDRGTVTAPAIAHGIARLHPDYEGAIANSQYELGPPWSLPPARDGRWVIDRIYQAAIRVEFDDSLPAPDLLTIAGAWRARSVADAALARARVALSSEETARRDEWLDWADKREAAEYVRKWHARRRREHGDLPAFDRGTPIKETHGGRERSTTVWHLANGRTSPGYRDPDRIDVHTLCSRSMTVDLGDDRGQGVKAGPPDATPTCGRCERIAAGEIARVAAEAATA